MKEDALISKGFYLKARIIQESWISHAPPHVREIWDWILLNANHKDCKTHGTTIKRGQLLTSYSDILEGLHWMVGYRKMSYKKHQCEIAMKLLTKHCMITTTKTTKGLIITVCNYNRYQNPQNYESHNEKTTKATMKLQPPDTINKNGKNGKNEQLKTLSASVDAASSENGSYLTRKKRKLTGKRLESFLEFWEAFGYRKGKAEAADAWLDIPQLTDSLVAQIVASAKYEAENREKLIIGGRTPKMAQGWITGRRWEDDQSAGQSWVDNYRDEGVWNETR